MFVLDHIALAAETLEAGVNYAEERLGVTLAPGGVHPLMGTHNRLLGIADGLYFEVIAINPAAPKPDHPRWFDLDNFSGAPRLTNWILRTDDLSHAPEAAGEAVKLARGDLRWQMAVPKDGKLPFDNLFPAMISWEGDLHPANMLPASGCRLKELVISHPDAAKLSASCGDFSDARVRIETGSANMRALFETPAGDAWL